SSLTFILDCSGSMSEVVALDNLKRTRLEAARSALQAILDSLAQSRNYRVAVRVYGHRARWRGRFSNEVIYTAFGQQEQQAALAAGQPFNVHPSNDVELVLPMGAFGPPENAAVKTVLDALEPAGETPLYLAVIESAVNDFRNEADSQQRIVVITDGVNEQSSGGPPGVIKLRQQVEEAFDQQRPRKIRLDIVGFNLNAGEQQAKLEDLKALARRTGGAYYSASDPSGLLKVLQDSLGLRKYAVENAQGELVDEPRELGTVTQLPPPRGRPQTYVARLAGAQPPVASEPLRVELSEALELFLSEDRRTFQSRRYTGSKEQELRDSLTDLADPQDPNRFAFIGVHLPEWQGSALRFPISIQNADSRRFSPRPAEAWVEIKPISPRRQQEFPAYTFFDLDCEPHRPVPVLSCLAASWPAKAEKAEIRAWCKFAPTAADEIIRLDQLDRGSGEAGIRLKSLRGAIVKVRTERAQNDQSEDRLTVAVQYSPGDLAQFGLKVELDPPPRRANHTYYPEGGLVRHTFAYGLGEADKLDHARIRFTTRAHLQQQAVSLSRPLTATVPDPLLRQ
ncbi:MAG TPA: hypothetical protein VHV08_07835, partial [Pirellulales bacterium]|nr:hypothetical protein [Pirellulales bacterium]